MSEKITPELFDAIRFRVKSGFSVKEGAKLLVAHVDFLQLENEKLVGLVQKLSARIVHRADCDIGKRRRFGRNLPCNCDLPELRAEIERVKGGK